MTATSAAHASAARPHAASPWAIFAVVSAAAFLVSLDATLLYSAFGALREGFPGVTAAELSWVLNAYTIVYAAALVPAGGLADAHGRKRVFVAGMAIFLAASAACGLAGSVGWLVAARVAQAIGAAMLTPASLSIVIAAFPASRRTLVVSAWGAVGGLAAAVGPSLGSFVVETVGWPWAFYLNLPVGAISMWRGATLLADVPRDASPRRVDLVGVALLIVGVGAISLAIVESESSAWTRIDLAAAALVGIAAVGAFIAWAKRARDPLVDLDLFRDRTYALVNLATLTFGVAFAMMFFTFFFYMDEVWRYGRALAGLAIMPGPLTVVPVAIVTGRLAGRYGHRPFLVGGALLYACAGAWFYLVPGATPAYLTQWLPGLLLSGASVGLVLPTLAGAAVSHLPPTRYAVGSAVNQATRQIGSVIGVAITVLVLGHAGVGRATFGTIYGMHIVLALVTAGLCAAIRPRVAAA